MSLLSVDVLRSTHCHLAQELLVHDDDLPQFYASYVQAVYRHRAQLFTADDFRHTVCAFLNLILRLDRVPVWTTRADLLTVLLNEGAYIPAKDPQEMLSTVASQAIANIDQPGATDSLSTILRLDYDILKPLIPQILTLILVLPVADAYINFLDLLLECHIKTRSIDELVHIFLTSIQQASLSSQRQPVVIEHDPFLGKLAKAIATFGTVAQCTGLIACIARFVEKKADEVGLKFELGAKIICVVLGSLNSEIVDEEGFEKLRQVKARVDRKVKRLVKKSSLSEKEERKLFPLLRVKYVCDRDVFVEEGDEGLMRLLDREESLLPELVFELVRTMFLHISMRRKDVENEKFFDSLLLFIERYYPQNINIGWSGTDCDLTTQGREGKIKCSLAVVWMIVERWLSELDSLATPRQIRRFLDVIFSVDLGSGNGLVNPESILLNVLHSAWFWEFGNIRKELVALLKERTSNRLESDMISTFRVLLYFPLDYFSFQVLSGFVGCAVEVDEDLVERVGDGKEEVIKGLVVLRMFVRRVCVFVGGGGVLEFRGKTEAELLLRILEKQVVVDCDMEEYLKASLDLAEVWLMRLFKSSKNTSNPEPVLRVLKAFNLNSICRSGRSLTFECFIRMVDLLDRDVGIWTSKAGIHADVLDALRSMRAELVEGLYGRIARDVLEEGLEDEGVVREYIGLVRVWDGLICLGRCVGGQQAPSRFVADKFVSVLMPYVQSRDALDGGLADLCIGVFGLILGEFDCKSQSGDDRRSRYLEVVLAIYVSWANKISVSGVKEMDVRLGRTVKRLAVSDFDHLLSFIAESLSDADSACESRSLLESRLGKLVHVGSLLIREHPSHSMAFIQKFIARCLGLFNDNPVYLEGDVSLRCQVLEMVGQYCSDQQAALRAQDTSLIWLLISKFLAPSQAHDPDTQTEIFHKIISILMSLIRLRRDLVTLGLPHLGLILRRMVFALRGCRPNLGAKQLGIVMNSQPRWVSHVRPLGGGEAKALSRVLESLTLKTTVRVAFGADHHVKAESLAKPFSKHAAYVLKAYVEAMNDPLCVVGKEVREELREPGIFAVCEMMSVYGRDALMVGGGLDVGGKGILKTVWKEWEGVRYVGKG